MIRACSSFVFTVALSAVAAVTACGRGASQSEVKAAPMETRDAAPPAPVEVSSSAPAEPVADAGPPRISDADKVVAAKRIGFRRCYQQGLAIDRKMAGRVVMDIRVSGDGAVTSGELKSREGLSQQVAECILAEMKTARFAAPGGAGSTLTIPVRFMQQDTRAGDAR